MTCDVTHVRLILLPFLQCLMAINCLLFVNQRAFVQEESHFGLAAWETLKLK